MVSGTITTYGPNNADRTFKFRQDTLELYQRYWSNPGVGSAESDGIFYTFQIADVQFFMLDDRSNRDPNDAPDRKTMFGDGQLQWLKQGLKASTATFKVIANGNSMVVDYSGRGERWDNFGTERDDFAKWLFSEEISGVIFIAGGLACGYAEPALRPGIRVPVIRTAEFGFRGAP